MAFSNLIFLYLFLPVTLLFYFAVPKLWWKNAVLLVASLVFYTWGEPVYVLLLVAVALVNYLAGRWMARNRKVIFILALCMDVALLCVVKYAGFLVENWNNLTGMHLYVPKIALPIGVSFYTFQVISYLVDVYRGKVEPQRAFDKFLLYVALFPQLIAGPIVRYADVCEQLTCRKTTADGAFYGMIRFCTGLAKKVLLADYAGKFANQLLAMPTQMTAVAAWLGAIFVMLQIYFDFSGYSDMAIGLGRILGFRYHENFDLPYMAGSITEFWRRWHISLGAFFRDYVYIPLGGNRKGKQRQIVNLLIVWLLTGLWHGAGWNFVLWGLYFFVLLVTEKSLGNRLQRIPAVLRHCGTLLLLLIGWVVFYFDDLSDITSTLAAMFGAGAGWIDALTRTRLVNALPLLVICIFGCTPLPRRIAELWNAAIGGGIAAEHGRRGVAMALEILDSVVIFAFCGLILYLVTVSLVGTGYSPFLYFRF